jgi:starvation-inducible outer membrane lipoprotein
MNKQTVFLITVLSLVLAGCTIPENLQKLTGQNKSGSSPEPLVVVESPKPEIIEEEEKSQGELLLTISSPKDGATLTSSSLTVKGTTVANAEVTVNDTDTKADSKGNWSAKITLEEGENEIVVTANDDTGAWAEQQLTVTYEPAS